MDARLLLHSHHIPHQDQLQDHHQVLLVLQLPQKDANRPRDHSLLRYTRISHRGGINSPRLIPRPGDILLALLAEVHPRAFLPDRSHEDVHVPKLAQLHHQIRILRVTDQPDHHFLRATCLHLRSASLLPPRPPATGKGSLSAFPEEEVLSR